MISVLAVGLCLVVSSNIGFVKSSATVQSSVVIIGERVELKCSVTGNNPTSWKYTSWNSSTETNIYLGRDIFASMRTRYKIDQRISGQHNLIIDSVDLGHAGRYRCIGVQNQSLINDVQLIVLGSHPVCSGNTNEANVTKNEQGRLHLSIWCRINYTGDGFPVFILTKINAENIAENAADSGTCQLPFTNTSLIKQQLQANDSGVTFYCLIALQTLSPSPETNIGVLEYTWNYSLYEPSNVSIVEHEDHLKCSTDGNPAPIYKRIDVEPIISIHRSVYSLNLTNDNEHTLYCTAETIFASVRKYNTIKDRAKDSDLTSDGSNSHIGLTASAIAGSIVVLLIILLIFGCVVYRKRMKGDSSARPDIALNTDLASYESDGRMISDNAVYAKVCKPKDDIALSSELSPNYILAGDPSAGRSDGRMISDNAVYAEVCKPTVSQNGSILVKMGPKCPRAQTAYYCRHQLIQLEKSDFEKIIMHVYLLDMVIENLLPQGPSTGNKGRNIGDNSRTLQHPTRVRKDLIGDDGTEYVNMGEGKSTDRKGVRHVSDPTAFSQETIYTSIDHSGRVPRPPLPTKW